MRSTHLCQGNDATGDGDGDDGCADRDCDDSARDAAIADDCGVCEGVEVTTRRVASCSMASSRGHDGLVDYCVLNLRARAICRSPHQWNFWTPVYATLSRDRRVRTRSVLGS
jgi:hypothetical protein